LVKFISVTSAEEMYQATEKEFQQTDITVLSAAVADYKPAHQQLEKIKKTADAMTIDLIKTVDIAKTLGEKKMRNQLLVGFALETQNEEENALKKLENKNMDLIVLNSLRDAQAAFGYDTNKIKIFDKSGLRFTSELKSKKEIAGLIIEQIYQHNA